MDRKAELILALRMEATKPSTVPYNGKEARGTAARATGHGVEAGPRAGKHGVHRGLASDRLGNFGKESAPVSCPARKSETAFKDFQ